MDPAGMPALIDDLRSTYHAGAYRLLGEVDGGKNCNSFSAELAVLLTGRGIPEHITNLPAEIMSTPFGAAIAPMLGGVEAFTGGMREEDAPALPTIAASLEAATGAAALADAPAAAVEASGSPRAAAALAAEVDAKTLAAAEEVVGAVADSAPSDARAAFEALVRREFDAVMASAAPSMTPNEAARVALERATAALRGRAEKV